MVTHKQTKRNVVIVGEANGAYSVQFQDGEREVIHNVDLAQLHVSGGVEELYSHLSRRQSRLKSKWQSYQLSHNKYGLTVEAIRKAGHRIKVCHFRYGKPKFEELTQFIKLKNPVAFDAYSWDEKRVVVEQPFVYSMVPAFMRKFYSFCERGGITVLKITTKDKQQISVTAFCSFRDLFCYKGGVNAAFDNLTQEQANLLLPLEEVKKD